MLEEAEKHGSCIVGHDVLGSHDPFQYGRLLDAANVHRRLKSLVHACGVKEHDYCCLRE